MDCRDLTPFGDHARGVRRRRLDFAADRSPDNRSDLLDHLAKIPTLLGDQGRIRRHARNDAHFVRLAYVLHLRRIKKELHPHASFFSDYK